MNVVRAFGMLGADTTSRRRLLSVTLNPTRDTGAVLQSCLHGFHPGFIPLRGSVEVVDNELRRLHVTLTDPPPKDVFNPAYASAVVVFGIADGESPCRRQLEVGQPFGSVRKFIAVCRISRNSATRNGFCTKPMSPLPANCAETDCSL